jgi:hypothetical protein
MESLKGFSNFLIDQSRTMRLEVEDTYQTTESTSLRVNDIFNQFHLLSNEKFIENVFFLLLFLLFGKHLFI